MTAKTLQTKDGFDFSKKNKVSVWISECPYSDIPDEYFEETFSKQATRATNTWSENYRLRYFIPTAMETNGAHEGTIDLERAAGECSFSASFITPLLSKARKKKVTAVTWIILLFECEYSSNLSGVEADQYTTFLGAFNYDDDAESLYDIED